MASAEAREALRLWSRRVARSPGPRAASRGPEETGAISMSGCFGGPRLEERGFCVKLTSAARDEASKHKPLQELEELQPEKQNVVLYCTAPRSSTSGLAQLWL